MAGNRGYDPDVGALHQCSVGGVATLSASLRGEAPPYAACCGCVGHRIIAHTNARRRNRSPDPYPSTGAPAPIEPDATRAPQPTVPPPDATAPAATDETRATLDLLRAVPIPQRDLHAIAIRLGRVPADTPRVVSASDPGYQLGDTLTFNVSNTVTEETFTAPATLRAQTAHASWWVANEMTVNQAGLDASAQLFESQTYPTNRAIFGSEWTPGVDGDPRLHIFLGEVPGVGGYYSSADEFPRSINPYSNEKEIFYINLNNASPGESYFDGILAHEFQHMIHWNTDRNEELWVNEGLSELAAQLNGFDVGRATDAFARTPDLPLTRWAEQSHPFYGSAFLFMNYFYHRFGTDAVTALLQVEADGPLAFDELLAPYDSTFDSLFSDWVVANLLDDPSVEDGRFDYPDDASQLPSFAESFSTFPRVDQAEVHQYGTDYIGFRPDNQRGTLRIGLTGDPTVSLLPTHAHSGDWMLWGNRGDDGDTTTTRAVDLRSVSSATLRFWTWYDLEPNYDYAYLLVSTDGGERWQIVPTAATTASNPHGNSFGQAFTGRSGQPEGSEEEPQWIEQSVDLSPFAGQAVLLRFEVITDDALNYNGFLVDDVSIPQIGYAEDFESGADGWESAGFARVDNLLPQRFIVQVVAQGSEGTRVLRLPLDQANQTEVTIPGFGTTTDRVTLLVSGATPFTSATAGYSFSARVEP